MIRHSHRAARALAHLGDRDPAMAALALWCQHRDHAGPTETTGDTIRYGPGFDHHPLHEQLGLVGHHVLHVALRHCARMGVMQTRVGPGFDQGVYALAADALVNETLLAAGYGLPRPVVRLSELLSAIRTPAKSARSGLADWDVDRLYMHLHGQAGLMGKARDYGASKAFHADLGLDDSGDDTSVQETDWRGHVVRAMELGRRAGSGIGMLAGALGELQAGQVPWEHHLRGLLARALSDVPRQSFKRPAGRWIAAEAQARFDHRPVPVFEPGRQRDAYRPRIAIGLDTSSSVDDLTLLLFAAEVAGIARRTGAECHVLGFDETVHTVRQMGPANWEDRISGLAMRRGGGTSYVDLFEHVAALDPAIAVVLTDLDGTFGPAARFRTVWAVPEETQIVPPFGDVLALR